MYYIYILECSDKTFYTGYTNNIEKRIVNHNKGLGAKYTRGRLPVELKYYEEFDSKSEALRREYEIKQLTRRQKVRLIEEFKKSE